VSALGLVLLTVFLVNDPSSVNQLDQSSQVGQREIASAHPAGTFQRDLSWQKNLASRIAELNEIPEGRSARPPSSIENFLFGELKGYYLMELKDDRIHEMVLNQKEAQDFPEFLGSEISLLERNKELWWLSFEKTNLKSRSTMNSVVQLLDQDQKVIGEAAFAWDADGRLMNLKIEKL
jgi:hypothetical protein